MQVTVTVTNNNPDTIWNKLAAKLGRGPTSLEAKQEVLRILAEGRAERATIQSHKKRN